MRARGPDATGDVERDGVELHWEIVRRRRHHHRPAADVVDHALAVLEGAGGRRSPAATGWSPSTAEAPVVSSKPVGAEAYTHLEFADDIAAVFDATGTERAVLVALSCGATWGIQFAADHPERDRSASSPSVRRSPLTPGHPGARDGIAVRRAARHHRGLGEVQPPLLGTGLPRTSSSSSSARCSTSRTRPSRSRTASAWGSEIAATGAGRRHARPAGVPARERSARSAPACARPCSSSTATRTASVRTPGRGPRRADRRAAASPSSGGGHGPQARDPIVVNRLIEEFVDTSATLAQRRRRHVGPRRAASEAGALHLVADRARPCAARRGDRRRTAQAPPRPADRLARPASR